MSRYRYAMTDKVEATINDLVTEHSFPSDAFSIPGELFRTKSGKILHGNDKCRKLRNKSGVVAVQKMRADVPTDNRCDCFYGDVGGTLGLRLKAATLIADLEKVCAVVSETTSLLGVQRLQARVDSFEAAYVPSVFEQRFTAALTEAQRTLTSSDTQACLAQGPRNAVRHCLAEMILLGAPARKGHPHSRDFPKVEPDSETALLLRDRDYGAVEGIGPAWSAFHAAVLNDQPTEAAVDMAIKAGVAGLPEAPRALTQTASITFDDIADLVSDDATVNGALIAAWRKKAVASLSETVRGWGAILDDALEAELLKDPQLVGITPQDTGSYNRSEFAAEAEDKKKVFPREQCSRLEILVLPQAVVAWLQAAQKSAGHYGSSVGTIHVSEPFPAAHAAPAIQVAKGLLEEGGMLSSDAIATAVLAVVPAA